MTDWKGILQWSDFLVSALECRHWGQEDWEFRTASLEGIQKSDHEDVWLKILCFYSSTRIYLDSTFGASSGPYTFSILCLTPFSPFDHTDNFPSVADFDLLNALTR